MTEKKIQKGEVEYRCTTLEEARNLITALLAVTPFFTENSGDILEITGITNVEIRIRFNAKIRKLEPPSLNIHA